MLKGARKLVRRKQRAKLRLSWSRGITMSTISSNRQSIKYYRTFCMLAAVRQAERRCTWTNLHCKTPFSAQLQSTTFVPRARRHLIDVREPLASGEEREQINSKTWRIRHMCAHGTQPFHHRDVAFGSDTKRQSCVCSVRKALSTL